MPIKMRGCGFGLLTFLLLGFGCLAPTWFVIMIHVVNAAENAEIAWYQQHGRIHDAVVSDKEVTRHGRVSWVLTVEIPDLGRSVRVAVNDSEYDRAAVGSFVRVWVADDSVRFVRPPGHVSPKFFFLLIMPIVSIGAFVMIYRRMRRRWEPMKLAA